MGIITGQLTYDNTVPTALCTVPAGLCNVVVCNVGPATVAVGPAGMMANTGFLLVPGAAPTSFVTTAISKGGGLNCCVTANGSSATVSYILST